MARAAVPGRLSWRVATITAVTEETAAARTLALDVPGWPGHVPGQHVDVRLTAEDGYTARRSYSVASAPRAGRLELTVQRLDDGEVSPYLAGIAGPGDQFELRGPVGGWFTWRPGGTAPLLLLAGGSGIVPLMSMVRAHGQAGSAVPVRLVYSARSPADVSYAAELSERSRASPLTVTYLYTRPPRTPPSLSPPTTPPITPAPPAPPASPALSSRVYLGRITSAVIADCAFSPDAVPAIYVCGPTGFVDTVASLLIAAGHPPSSIRTERFGPTAT